MNKKIAKFKWYDISLIKLCVLACGLLLAKLVPEVLSLHWWVYAGVAIFTYILIWVKMLRK